MTAPIPLFGRDQVPQPDGEPEITMFMDDDRIVFRDQQALDAYTQADTDAALERAAQAIEGTRVHIHPPSDRTNCDDGCDWLEHAASIVRSYKSDPFVPTPGYVRLAPESPCVCSGDCRATGYCRNEKP